MYGCGTQSNVLNMLTTVYIQLLKTYILIKVLLSKSSQLKTLHTIRDYCMSSNGFLKILSSRSIDTKMNYYTMSILLLCPKTQSSDPLVERSKYSQLRCYRVSYYSYPFFTTLHGQLTHQIIYTDATDTVQRHPIETQWHCTSPQL